MHSLYSKKYTYLELPEPSPHDALYICNYCAANGHTIPTIAHDVDCAEPEGCCVVPRNQQHGNNEDEYTDNGGEHLYCNWCKCDAPNCVFYEGEMP